ncbi:MAG: group 1 glycosyl transferase, partial [Candidatus Berkelbacteria bacterium Licking1014_2]
MSFLKIWSRTPVYTIVYNPKTTGGVFEKYDIRPSFIQKIPGGVNHYKYFLALMPKAVESFNLSAYDIILSNCSAFAKGVITDKNRQTHICYLHTPTRYLWQDRQSYIKSSAPPIVQPYLFWLTGRLKKWDLRASQRPNIIIANSQTVAERTKKYYQRSVDFIHPFVQLDKFFPDRQIKRQDFYLMTGRLVYYKKYDIVVELFAKNPAWRLKIAGAGV